jgi:3',5'-nucleoside bisphosphate phosphatase
MKNRRFALCLVLVICFVSLSFADKYFPDFAGYQTLVCDFHTHTVFSDGQVWPSVRVAEAKRESIDVIAITDHIEYLPHKNDLPKNLNRSYQIAKSAARKSKVLVIKGAEITRDTPPGHYNALFINDVTPLDNRDILTQIKNANEQKGFVFLNHHTWKGKEKGMWSDLQTTMYDNKWLHGMEVANGGSYYPLAHQWCLDKDLTMLGNSDIHAPSIDHKYAPDNHRSLTLVFAKERTKESVREALKAGRTAVWYKNTLIGKEEYLTQLFRQIVKVSDLKLKNGGLICKLTNSALIDLDLESKGTNGPEKRNILAKCHDEFC